MEVSRREMAVAGAAALAVPGMLLGAFSVAEAAADESAIVESVEVLRKAWINVDLIWIGALGIAGSFTFAAGVWSVAT